MTSSRLRIGVDLGALDGAPPVVADALRSMLQAVAVGRIDDVELVLFAPEALAETWAFGGAFEMHVLPLGGVRLAGAARTRYWLPVVLGRAGIDVVHVPAGAIVPDTDLPVVLGIEDLAAFDVERSSPSRLQAGLRRKLASAVTAAETITVPSRFMAGRVHERLGVPAGRIQVIPPVLPEHVEPAPIDTVRARYGIIGRIILLPAPTAPQYEQVVALRAMKHLAERHHETTLVLAGPVGLNEKRVLREIDDLDLDSHVVRIAEPTAAVRSSLFEHASVVVHPAVYSGSAPAVVEAMACGVPVVVARAGAAAELVGDAGAQIDPGDDVQLAVELHGILEDGEWSRRRVAAGLARAQQWTAERAAEALLTAYRSVLVDH